MSNFFFIPNKFLKNILPLGTLVIILVFLSGCNQQKPLPQVKKEILIYCGSTMIQPVRKIADMIQRQENCIVKIIQNGSGSLLRSITINRQGDLYFPGSESYIEKALKKKLISETIFIASNRVALIVAKDNPLQITADLNSLLNPDYHMVLGAPDSGSIGNETQKILTREGIYDQVISKALYLTNDSKELTNAISQNNADITMNWLASSVWPGNKAFMDALPLSDEIAPPHKLILGLLRFSSQPEIARRFMKLAASPQGKAIFAEHGFRE